MFRTRIIASAAIVAVALFLILRREDAPFPPINTVPPVDCVRVLSGNSSQFRHLAVAELFRVGFRNISIQVEQLDPSSHKRGCHNSHVRAHRWGVTQNCRTLMVVEDDIVLTADVREAWAALTAFMALETDWDAIYLGYTALKINQTKHPGIVRLFKPMLMHAVVFPIRTSRKIIEMPPWAVQPANLSITEAYDVRLWYSGVVSRAYGVYPAVAGQRGSQRTSHSRDKNMLLDWAKTVNGMNWVNWLALEKCAGYYRYADTAATVLGGIIDGADDWASTARVFTCD